MNTNLNILFRNFDVFSQSEKSLNNFKSLIFQLALTGKLDFQKLSEGHIKKPLQTLIKQQKAHLKKEGIAFEEELKSPLFNGTDFQKSLEKQNENLKFSKLLIKEEKNHRKEKTPTNFKSADNIWPMVKLGDICKILDNKRRPVRKSDRKSGQYPYYGATGILDYVDNYIFDEKLVLVGEDGAKWKSGENTAFIAEGQYWVNNHAHILRPNRKYIIDELLVYILNEKDISLFITGITVPKLNQKKLYSIKIPLPPLEVQKEIVTLMQKCALWEAQIKEKSQKQKEFSKSSMYFITQSKNKKELSHYWKILKSNFKDILHSENGAKEFKSMVFQLCLNGNLNFQKLSEGRIKKPLQALIKEQKAHLKKEGIAFEEQSGSIWPMVELGKILSLEYGKSLKKSDRKGGHYPVFGSNGIDGYHNKYLIKAPLIIIGRKGSAGKVNYYEKNGFPIDTTFYIKLKKLHLVDLKHLFFQLKKINLKRLSSQSAVPGINRNHVYSIKIPLPSLEVQKEIVALMQDMENTEKQIQEEKNLSIQLSKSLSHFEKYKKLYNI